MCVHVRRLDLVYYQEDEILTIKENQRDTEVSKELTLSSAPDFIQNRIHRFCWINSICAMCFAGLCLHFGAFTLCIISMMSGPKDIGQSDLL